MQKHITFFIALFISLTATAQVSLDSLWNVWNDKTQADSNRLNAIYKITWDGYLFSKPDSASYLVQMMFNLAKSSNNKRAIARSYNLKGIAFQIKGQNDSAIHYFNEVNKAFTELNYKRGIAVSLNNIALALKDLGDYSKCLEYFNKAYVGYKQAKDFKNQGSALRNIGLIYSDIGNYPVAMQYFQKARYIRDSINHESGLAYSLNQIGKIIFDFEKNIDKALDYYLKALDIRERINDRISIPISLIYIGEVYKAKGNHKKALDFYNRALNICQEIGEKKRVSETYIEIGNLYIDLKDYEQALIYFYKAKKINEFVDYKKGLALSLNKIGLVYEISNRPEMAINNAKRALEITTSLGDLEGIALSSSVLFRNYKKINAFSNALTMQELNVLITDSIQNRDNLRSVINQQYKYEYDKKAISDSIRHKDEILIHQAKVEKEQILRNGTILLLFLIIAFSIFIYTRFRLIKKQKDLINQQKKTVDIAYNELDIQKNKVEQKNKQIITSINYAQKIQNAILPKDDLIKAFFSEHFVLFQPKDIVGGDFYWYRCFGDMAAIACVDCTGHGVPGGFMSMMGSLLLDKLIQKDQLDPSEILEQLSNDIIRVLNQNAGGEIQDGMDMSICVIDKKNMKLHFSGARNGILITDKENITHYKADLLPVGGAFSRKSREMNRKFTTQSISITKDSWIIMYSDGYYDQLGGNKVMSMESSRFEEIIQSAVNSNKDKKEFLMNQFKKWRGDFPQIDDLLVIGLRV